MSGKGKGPKPKPKVRIGKPKADLSTIRNKIKRSEILAQKLGAKKKEKTELRRKR